MEEPQDDEIDVSSMSQEEKDELLGILAQEVHRISGCIDVLYRGLKRKHDAGQKAMDAHIDATAAELLDGISLDDFLT